MASPRADILVKSLIGLVLLLLLPLELMLRTPLETSGVRLIERIQSSFSYHTWHSFFSLLASLKDWVLLLVSPVVMQWGDPRRGVKVVMVLSLGMYLLTLVNLIYGEPRPFWISSSVKGYQCAKGYASPDYMLAMLTCVYFYCAFQYALNARIMLQRTIWMLGGVFVLGTSLAQMYEGVIYLHQIVTTLCYCFLIVSLSLLFDKQLSHIAYVSAFRYKENRVHSMYWYIGTLALMLTAVTVFDLITMQRFINGRWVENANTSCEMQADLSYDESFFSSAWAFYNMCLLNGCMFLGKFMPERWWETSRYKSGIRTLFTMGAAIGLRFLFRTPHLDAVPAKDTTTKYVFFYVLHYSVSAYVLALFPLLAKKIKLTSDDAEASSPILVPMEEF